MASEKRICVFSGTRAEYGLLNPLMHKIKRNESIELCIMVSGSHLSDEFGSTYREIEADGFYIDEKVEINTNTDSASGVCKSMGLGLIQYSDALKRLNPDIIIILGDRYEAFSLAASALVSNIPIAHIHGGESSFGTIDESFRHAITKMSYLHFTCSDHYRNRVIQLGEHPDRVFNAGALGVENIDTLTLLRKKELAELTGFASDSPYFLITYHPETAGDVSPEKDFTNILNILSCEKFLEFRLIFTKANSDPQGRRINKKIDEFVDRASGRAVMFDSMGQINYLSAMKYAKAMIGNSSSGIIEAPSFKTPVINVGNRQKGRLKADNVIDCNPFEPEIMSAVREGLSEQFTARIKEMENPFQKDGTSDQILSVIKNADLSKSGAKEFYDLPCS